MTVHVKVADLRAQRAKAYEDFKAIAEKTDFNPATDTKALDDAEKAVLDIDAQIDRVTRAQALSAASAQPVAGQEKATVPAEPETDSYVKDKSLMLGGIAKMIGIGGGNVYNARQASKDAYGENHPVTKALETSTGGAGGFLVPPDVMTEVIPLLRAKAVVRKAGPRMIPMPRGTMTIPGAASAATARYGKEGRPIQQSQQTLRDIVASFKKLTALVPVSNDMMRYATPAIDAFVRDDMVKVMALTEDFNFMLSDGSQDTPRGFLSFANGHVATNGGTVGTWLTTGNSIFAINGADPANATGGNFITSTANYTLATVAQELGGAVNRLDQANVDEDKRVWFMNPRSWNYLNNVQNSLGVYVYRDELSRGTLLGYPVMKTTQIGTSYWDTNGTNKDLSFVFLVEMTQDMILDSMQLELAVFREGSYVDASGNTVSAMQNDQTVIRAIAEHDHQLRHQAAVAVIQGVRWAPAIQ
ncbi:phage major capsid protein [Bradyrhizobium sp. SZCCHNRI2049]|uniref:phage major capsid protein n=1 Tax=Bradyrhizobium sp. SZCCHNRI2049 TaxID=3057287 RepID=UPI002915E9C3|nr:phage major capsid protein [Bradyrhizobium sp. SZCCHNRI2049]